MVTEADLTKLLGRLNQMLDKRQAEFVLYQDYYEGRHRSMFRTANYRKEFGYLANGIRINFCVLVVDAERERLTVDGVRLGEEALDKEAWRIWQANKLDSRSDIAHTESLVNGISYVVVGPNPKRQDTPSIRIEDAMSMVVLHDPGDADSRVAALKRFLDDDRHELAYLYTPDAIYKFRSRQPRQDGAASQTERGNDYWVRREVRGEQWPLPNPLGVVPVIPIANNPGLRVEYRSELAPVVPIQDQLNKLAADLIIASEFIAYPQRWATGLEITEDDEGKPLPPFQAGMNRLWGTEGENVKFGEFGQASLAPYVSAIEMYTQQMASITKTPPHYLLGQSGNFPSGESLKATETGLVSKSRQASRFFGEAWEESLVLALRIANQSVPNVDAVEVKWRDPENRVQSEVTDAVVKEMSIGVPFEFALEKLGYTQVEIQRIKVMKLQEAMEAEVPLTVIGGPVPTRPAAVPEVAA